MSTNSSENTTDIASEVHSNSHKKMSDIPMKDNELDEGEHNVPSDSQDALKRPEVVEECDALAGPTIVPNRKRSREPSITNSHNITSNSNSNRSSSRRRSSTPIPDEVVDVSLPQNDDEVVPDKGELQSRKNGEEEEEVEERRNGEEEEGDDDDDDDSDRVSVSLVNYDFLEHMMSSEEPNEVAENAGVVERSTSARRSRGSTASEPSRERECADMDARNSEGIAQDGDARLEERTLTKENQRILSHAGDATETEIGNGMRSAMDGATAADDVSESMVKRVPSPADGEGEREGDVSSSSESVDTSRKAEGSVLTPFSDGQALGHFVWNEMSMLLFGRLFGLLHYWCGVIVLESSVESRRKALKSLKEEACVSWEYRKARMVGNEEWETWEEKVGNELMKLLEKLSATVHEFGLAPRQLCSELWKVLEESGFADGTLGLTSHDMAVRRSADLSCYSYQVRRDIHLDMASTAVAPEVGDEEGGGKAGQTAASAQAKADGATSGTNKKDASQEAEKNKGASGNSGNASNGSTASAAAATATAAAAPPGSDGMIYRVGRFVKLPYPHPHPDINTRIVLAEPRRRKTPLDDSRIFSHPKRATTFGVEDFLVDDELTYRALVTTKRHLTVYGSLRYVSPFNNFLVWHTLDRDDDIFDKVFPPSRTGPAPVPYISMLMRRIEEKVSVMEASRRSVRDMAQSIGWFAVSANWRDQISTTLNETSIGSAILTGPDWYQLRDTGKSGFPAEFPNHIRTNRVHVFILRQLAKYATRRCPNQPPEAFLQSASLIDEPRESPGHINSEELSGTGGGDGARRAQKELDDGEDSMRTRRRARQEEVKALSKAAASTSVSAGNASASTASSATTTTPTASATGSIAASGTNSSTVASGAGLADGGLGEQDDHEDDFTDAEWQDTYLITRHVLIPLLTGESPTYFTSVEVPGITVHNFQRYEHVFVASMKEETRLWRVAQDQWTQQSAMGTLFNKTGVDGTTKPEKCSNVVSFFPQAFLPALQALARTAQLCSAADFSVSGADSVLSSIACCASQTAVADLLRRTEPDNLAVAPLVAIPVSLKQLVECCTMLKKDELFVAVVAGRCAAESTGLPETAPRSKDVYPYFRAIGGVVESVERSDEVLALSIPIIERDPTNKTHRSNLLERELRLTATLHKVPRVWIDDHKILVYEEQRFMEERFSDAGNGTTE